MLMRLRPWNKKNKVKALKVIINVDVDVSAAVEYKPPLVKKRKAGFQAEAISYFSFWHFS